MRGSSWPFCASWLHASESTRAAAVRAAAGGAGALPPPHCCCHRHLDQCRIPATLRRPASRSSCAPCAHRRLRRLRSSCAPYALHCFHLLPALAAAAAASSLASPVEPTTLAAAESGCQVEAPTASHSSRRGKSRACRQGQRPDTTPEGARTWRSPMGGALSPPAAASRRHFERAMPTRDPQVDRADCSPSAG